MSTKSIARSQRYLAERAERRATNGMRLSLADMPSNVEVYESHAAMMRADQIAFLETLDPIAGGACPIWCGHAQRDESGNILLDPTTGKTKWVLDAARWNRLVRAYIDAAKLNPILPDGVTVHPFPYDQAIKDLTAYCLAIMPPVDPTTGIRPAGNLAIALLCARSFVGSKATISDSMALGGMGMRGASEHAVWLSIHNMLISVDAHDKARNAQKPNLEKIDSTRKDAEAACEIFRTTWLKHNPTCAVLPSNADLGLIMAPTNTPSAAARNAASNAQNGSSAAIKADPAPMAGQPLASDYTSPDGYLAALVTWIKDAPSAAMRDQRRYNVKLTLAALKKAIKESQKPSA